MNSNKTVNSTCRYIPTLLEARVRVLPWNRLEVTFSPKKFDIEGWRTTNEEIRIRWTANNSYNKIDDTHIYYRLREWDLKSRFQKFEFFLTDSGNIYVPDENAAIIGISCIKIDVPILKGDTTGEEIINIRLFQKYGCELGGFALNIDFRQPNLWNYCWTTNDICYP
jgi:hypothetical protein